MSDVIANEAHELKMHDLHDARELKFDELDVVSGATGHVTTGWNLKHNVKAA